MQTKQSTRQFFVSTYEVCSERASDSSTCGHHRLFVAIFRHSSMSRRSDLTCLRSVRLLYIVAISAGAWSVLSAAFDHDAHQRCQRLVLLGRIFKSSRGTLDNAAAKRINGCNWSVANVGLVIEDDFTELSCF